MDNLWHVLFHAVPTHDFATGRAAVELATAASIVVLPRYLAFLPHPLWSEKDRIFEPPPVVRWHAFELLIRSLGGTLTGSSARGEGPGGSPRSDLFGWERVANRTHALVRSNATHCYQRVLGGHALWWPSLVAWTGEWNVSQLVAARPRFAALRERLAASVHARPSSISTAAATGAAAALRSHAALLTFVLRQRGRARAIANEASLRAALVRAVRSDGDANSALRFVHLEEMPLCEQLRVAYASCGLVGVHTGTALTVPSLCVLECVHAVCLISNVRFVAMPC
jgi:hypothetical protein